MVSFIDRQTGPAGRCLVVRRIVRCEDHIVPGFSTVAHRGFDGVVRPLEGAAHSSRVITAVLRSPAQRRVGEGFSIGNGCRRDRLHIRFSFADGHIDLRFHKFVIVSVIWNKEAGICASGNLEGKGCVIPYPEAGNIYFSAGQGDIAQPA